MAIKGTEGVYRVQRAIEKTVGCRGVESRRVGYRGVEVVEVVDP
jgi:hypothetical protein